MNKTRTNDGGPDGWYRAKLIAAFCQWQDEKWVQLEGESVLTCIRPADVHVTLWAMLQRPGECHLYKLPAWPLSELSELEQSFPGLTAKLTDGNPRDCLGMTGSVNIEVIQLPTRTLRFLNLCAEEAK